MCTPRRCMLRHEAVKKELAETTCRPNLTHTISLTRIFTGMPDAKIPASRQVGFLACASGGGGTKYFHRSTVPQTIIYSVTTCVASCTPLQIGIAPDLMFALIVSHEEHHRMFVQQYLLVQYPHIGHFAALLHRGRRPPRTHCSPTQPGAELV